MIDRKEIEMLVRAQVKGEKDIDSVTKSINDLALAIGKQSAAAKRGEGSIDELRASYESLKRTQEELARTAGAVGGFQKSQQEIDKLQAKLVAATKAYNAYSDEIKGTGEITEKQASRLKTLQGAIDRTNTSLSKQQGLLAQYTKDIEAAGFSTKDLSAAEDRLRQSAVNTGTAMNRVQEAIGSYAANSKKAAAALKEQQAAEAAARAETEKTVKAEQAAEAAARKRAEAAKQQFEAQRAQADAQRVASAQSGNEFANLAAEKQRATTLAALREDIIRRSNEQLDANKRLAADNSLKQQADDAEKTAKSYTTLARASGDLRPKIISLREALSSISDPGAAQRQTLGGVETQIEKTAAAVKTINGPVKEYQATLREIEQTQKALASQAGLVDNFRRQTDALRQTRAEFVQARAQVASYAAQVRQGGEAGAEFTAKLADAQNKLRGASVALQSQLGVTREARDALRNAGIATNELAAAETRLTNATKTNVASVNQLSDAMKKYGAETEKASKGRGLFGDEGRTTLSFMQRLRGEILALTTAYIGLQGAIGTAQKTIEATNSRDTIRNQLSLSAGTNRQTIDEEYNYVKGQADRIGLQFDRAAAGYAKFAAAASKAGEDRKNIKIIWESFAEVGRVANLSVDDLDGVYKALEQIVSKGKIQAEELRGQLGDRLFGAFQVAQQALAKTYPDLNKAMEQGLVTSDHLLEIAEEYRKTVAEQLPAATNSLTAQQARLNNALFDFRLAVGDAGFTDAYTQLVKDLTAFFKSDDGKKFAQGLGQAFKSITDGLIFLLKNLDTVLTVSKAILITWGSVTAVKWIAEGVVAFKTLAGVVGQAKTAVTAFSAEWPLLSTAVKSALGVIGAAIAGWGIGTLLRNQFAEVRVAGTVLVTGLDEVWTRIKYGVQILFEEVPRYAQNAFISMINYATSWARGLIKLVAQVAAAMGKADVAESLNKMADSMTVALVQQSDKTKQLRKQMEDDISAIRKIQKDMIQDDLGPGVVLAQQKAVAAQGAQATTGAVASGRNVKPAVDEAAIKKRQTLIDEVARSLEQLDAKIDRGEKDSLKSQLSAIDHQYLELQLKIEKIGGETGKMYLKRMEESITALRAQTIKKFNDDLLKEQEAIQNKLEDIEAAGGKKQKQELESRLEAIKIQYADLYRQIEAQRAVLEANNKDTSIADAAKTRLDAGILVLQNAERIKYATEQQQIRENAVNQQLELRKKLLDAVQAQKETGAITDEQAAQRINEINTQAVPAIQAAAQASIQWAQANAAIFANPEQMQAYIAMMQAIADKAAQVPVAFTELQKQVGEGGVKVISGGLDQVATSLTDILANQKSVSEGFKEIGKATLGIFAQFLRDIALATIKLQIFNLMKQSGNPFLAAIGTAGAASVSVKHSGGRIGPGPSNRTRTVSPAIFANAPRYHEGGVQGLKQDEYATILQKNEEVLAADSPRNIMNGGGQQQGGQQEQGTRFVLVDDRARMAEAMNGSDGERVVVQHLRNNLPTIKQWLRGG